LPGIRICGRARPRLDHCDCRWVGRSCDQPGERTERRSSCMKGITSRS
jgi:hypothetical protein